MARKNDTNGRWKDLYLFKIYDMTKQGLPQTEICKRLDIKSPTYFYWLKVKPVFKLAVTEAKKIREEALNSLDGDETNVRDYIYKRLDPEMKEYWDELNRIESTSKKNRLSPFGKVEKLFSGQGKKRMRQCLFIHAWICSNFSISAAMRKVNLTRCVYNQWVNGDEQFAQLCKDVFFFKKDFAESALCKLVAGGDTAATIALNNAYNRNLGFGRSDIKVKHEGEIIHTHIAKMSDLKLSLETRRSLLTALQDANTEN